MFIMHECHDWTRVNRVKLATKNMLTLCEAMFCSSAPVREARRYETGASVALLLLLLLRKGIAQHKVHYDTCQPAFGKQHNAKFRSQNTSCKDEVNSREKSSGEMGEVSVNVLVIFGHRCIYLLSPG